MRRSKEVRQGFIHDLPPIDPNSLNAQEQTVAEQDLIVELRKNTGNEHTYYKTPLHQSDHKVVLLAAICTTDTNRKSRELTRILHDSIHVTAE